MQLMPALGSGGRKIRRSSASELCSDFEASMSYLSQKKRCLHFLAPAWSACSTSDPKDELSFSCFSAYLRRIQVSHGAELAVENQQPQWVGIRKKSAAGEAIQAKSRVLPTCNGVAALEFLRNATKSLACDLLVELLPSMSEALDLIPRFCLFIFCLCLFCFWLFVCFEKQLFNVPNP